MRAGSIEHERFITVLGGFASRWGILPASVALAVPKAQLERLVEGAEPPDEALVRRTAALCGMTCRMLLSGDDSPPTSPEEARELGRAEALQHVIALLEESAAQWDAIGLRDRAESVRGAIPLLMTHRLGDAAEPE